MVSKQHVVSNVVLSVLFVVFSTVGAFAQPAPGDNINNPQFIPDANFRSSAEVFLGKAPGGAFTLQEANDATGDFTELSGSGVSDMTGIEFFINITTLDASDNNITTVDVSQNTQLESLDLSNNNLSSLDVSGLQSLEILRVGNNALSSITGLNIDNTPFIEEIDISNNAFSVLDVSNFVFLRGLNIASNSFDTLTFSSINLGLKDLNIANNNFSTLDVSNLVNLEDLNASSNNFDTIGGAGDELDLTGNPNLIVLNLSSNADLTATPPTPPILDLNAIGDDFPLIDSKLTNLDVSNNFLTTLDIADLRALTKLQANDNAFSSFSTPQFFLDTTFQPELRTLNLSGNELIGSVTLASAWTPFDLTRNTNLTVLDISDNSFGELPDGTGVPGSTDFLSAELAKIDPTPGVETLREVNLSRNPIVTGGAPLNFSTNVALERINISRLNQTFSAGLRHTDLTLTGLVNLVEFNASFNPAFFDTTAVVGLGSILNLNALTLDIPGTGSLEILNLEATSLGGDSGSPAAGAVNGILVNGEGGAPFVDGLNISDPTTITTLILAGNEFSNIQFGTDNAFFKHSKLLGGKISTAGTGERFKVVDFRNNRFIASTVNDVSSITGLRNAFLIETTARPNAQETTFDEIGRLTNGVAFAPVREATGGFFPFESGVDPSKQIKLIFPNGGEQFDSSDFFALPTTAPSFAQDLKAVWSKELTLATTLAAGNDINIQISTDGGAAFTDLAGSPYTIATGNGNPESTAFFLTSGDLQDADGNDINSSQVVFRAISANDPTLFDTSDFFVTANKGSVISEIFTGLSVTFPNDLFVNPKGSPPQVEVDVNVSNPVGIDNFVLQFRFDPNVFFFVEGNVDTTGTASSSFPDPVVTFNNQTGTLTIAAASVNPVPNSPLVPNTLIKFRLNAFSFAETGQSSDIELVSAVARINEDPVQVSKASVFVVRTFLFGDVNGNGSVGVLDANEILRFVAFAVDSFTGFPDIVRPDFPGAADVNGDGLVGAGDAAQVLRFVAGVITTFAADDNGDGIGPDPINPAAGKFLARSTNLKAAVNGNSMSLSLDDAGGVNSFRLVLNYDPSKVSVSESGVHALADMDMLVANNDAANGQLTIVGATINDLPSGAGGLVSVDFASLSDAPGVIEVDLSQSTVNDGAVTLSAQSDTEINLNDSTGVPSWMVY